MDPRRTYTSINVRAGSITAGDIVKVGGMCFTRLSPKHQLSRHSIRQRARYVEVLSAVHDVSGWIELRFMGGDSPHTQREMYALYRPYELLQLQVAKEM